MDPNLRTAILAGGLTFCGFFVFMTFAVAFDSSFDLFTLAALGVIGLIALGLLGAMRNPPDD
jgi:hypothetical protein